jgi:hypothetical protein
MLAAYDARDLGAITRLLAANANWMHLNASR